MSEEIKIEQETVYERGYKAYEPGLICRGKQYEENTVYEEEGGNLCGAGMMHYCVNPFDVLRYYPLVDGKGRFSEFTTVEALAKPKKDESKSATKKLRISVKLGLDGFIKACVDFLYERTIKEMPKDSVESGYAARIGSSGDAAQIGSSGRYARIGSSGDAAQIGSSGDAAQIGSSGRYARIGSSGDDVVVICEKDNAVICCAGKRGKVKGPVGTWITLSEYGEGDGEGWPCICVKSAKIDGETLKADTFYMLRGGEFVEVAE